MTAEVLATLLAIVSAALLGVGAVLARIGVRYASVRVGASISVPITAFCFWLLAPALLRFDHASLKAILIFAAIGIFFPAAVTLLNFESARRLGPSIASALGASTALFSAVLAVAWLGERLSLTMLVGTLVIVGGVAVIAFRQGGQRVSFSKQWLLIPIAGAAIRATAQTAMKYALAIWSNPFAATLLSYTVSGVLLFGTRPKAIAYDRKRSVLWFALAGLCNGCSVLAMYAALQAGPVTLVAPLATTAPLFAVMGSALILREEHFDRRLLFGIVLTVAGAALLVAK